MRYLRVVTAVACAGVGCRSGYAQEWVGFDAALGTDPLAQCFGAFGPGNFAATQEERVVAEGELRLRTSGGAPHVGSPANQPKAGFFARRDLEFRFADGFAMEATMRVLHAGISPASPLLRTGLTMNAMDSEGRTVAVWWGDGGLWLLDSLYATAGAGPDLVFPAISEYHTYRVEVDASNMTLYIDGAMAVRKALGGVSAAAPRVCLGDASRWVDANCDIRVREFRFFAGQPIPGVMPPVEYVRPCRLGAASMSIDVPVPEWSVLAWEYLREDGEWAPIAARVDELSLTQPALGVLVAQPLSARALGSEWWFRARLDATDVTSRCRTGHSEPVRVRFCVADFNCDGGVDSDDTIAFFGALDRGHGSADVNRDGGIDADDIIDFFADWDAGCN